LSVVLARIGAERKVGYLGTLFPTSLFNTIISVLFAIAFPRKTIGLLVLQTAKNEFEIEKYLVTIKLLGGTIKMCKNRYRTGKL
jgi:hypothetical protein